MTNTALKFNTLALSPATLDNLQAIGFTEMTPVQAQALPHILNNKDVLAQAKTGSGKTAAFGLGVLKKLDIKQFKVQTLVLCPTRELADQVAVELRRLAKFTQNIKILTLCGGTPFWPQTGSLKHGVHIVVGTAGRVLKHLNKGHLSLAHLNTLVLDEADKMLDMGFIDDIEAVIAHAPEQRQTLLFSATYPKRIKSLSAKIQQKAINIETVSKETANPIKEYFYPVSPYDKRATLLKILHQHQPANVLVFSNTKLEAQDIANNLRQKGVSAKAIHGDLEQYERTEVMEQFSNHSCTVLVATDVAARGLDIKDLAMVVNYDMPQDKTVYTHRIGRTGRAGATGLAFSLYTGHQADEYRNEARCFADPSGLPDNQTFNLQPPNKTLIIKAGKKNKLRAGDILGALTGKTGIEGQYVGKISVYDRHSYVAIRQDHINTACEQLKQGKIKGRKYSTWVLK